MKPDEAGLVACCAAVHTGNLWVTCLLVAFAVSGEQCFRQLLAANEQKIVNVSGFIELLVLLLTHQQRPGRLHCCHVGQPGSSQHCALHYRCAMSFKKTESGAVLPALCVLPVCSPSECVSETFSTSPLLSAVLDFLLSVSGFIDKRCRHVLWGENDRSSFVMLCHQHFDSFYLTLSPHFTDC